jgi:hypothetical protein
MAYMMRRILNILLTSLDLAICDPHIFASSDVNAVSVRTRTRCCDGQLRQLRIGAVLDRHVDLLAIHNFQIVHLQIGAVVE